MQFINIVVHSVENMNFRVHLQYEFTRHGLDDYLEVGLTFDPFGHRTFHPSCCSKCRQIYSLQITTCFFFPVLPSRS